MRQKENKTQKFLIILLLIAVLFLSVVYIKSKLPSINSGLPIEENIESWEPIWQKEMNNYCLDEIQLAPEFERALSLVMSRFWEKESTQNLLVVIRANQKCVDISYAPSVEYMSGADGLFLFSEEESGPNGLKIYINPEYKIQDDILTAILLSHELTHAEQFIYSDVAKNIFQKCLKVSSNSFCQSLYKSLYTSQDDTPEGCVQKESQAFLNQLLFYASLKEVERDSIVMRANAGKYNYLHFPAYIFVTQVNELSKKCPLTSADNETELGRWRNCMENFYIKSNSFYQKQCNL